MASKIMNIFFLILQDWKFLIHDWRNITRLSESASIACNFLIDNKSTASKVVSAISGYPCCKYQKNGTTTKK